MPERSIEELLGQLPAPSAPDATFQAQLRARLTAELHADPGATTAAAVAPDPLHRCSSRCSVAPRRVGGAPRRRPRPASRKKGWAPITTAATSAAAIAAVAAAAIAAVIAAATAATTAASTAGKSTIERQPLNWAAAVSSSVCGQRCGTLMERGIHGHRAMRV